MADERDTFTATSGVADTAVYIVQISFLSNLYNMSKMMHSVHQYVSTGRECIIPMSAHTPFLHYMHNCLQYFGDRFD